MCNRVAIPLLPLAEETFKAKVEKPEVYKQYFHVNTWDQPLLPVINGDNKNLIKLALWATQEGFDTYNARNDKVFENFHKEKIRTGRVWVIVSGFFEYRKVEKKSYPYFIRLKHGRPFVLGGIINKFNNLSIITTEANETMKMIHNQAKRMPLILTEQNQHRWIENDLFDEEINDLMIPCPDDIMQYHTVNKIPQKPELNNVEETIKEFSYPELNSLMF